MKNEQVRVSVANLASYLRNNDTGEVAAFGVMNIKRFSRGEKFLQALGGAASVDPRWAAYLVRMFGADFQEKGEDAYDARFIIPREHLRATFSLFECVVDICEKSPMREVLHELEQEDYFGASILHPHSLAGATSLFGGMFHQESGDGKGTSARAANQDVSTKRLFYVHALCVSNRVFLDILASPYVKRLSETELETTQSGRTKGTTKDGIPMADNLCNWIPGFITA